MREREIPFNSYYENWIMQKKKIKNEHSNVVIITLLASSAVKWQCYARDFLCDRMAFVLCDRCTAITQRGSDGENSWKKGRRQREREQGWKEGGKFEWYKVNRGFKEQLSY